MITAAIAKHIQQALAKHSILTLVCDPTPRQQYHTILLLPASRKYRNREIQLYINNDYNNNDYNNNDETINITINCEPHNRKHQRITTTFKIPLIQLDPDQIVEQILTAIT
jgi:hypothetical protein